MRSAADTSLPRTWCHNTFFYEKLMTEGYSKVQRWTVRGPGLGGAGGAATLTQAEPQANSQRGCPGFIFAYDYIITPLHLGVHWCCGVINFKDKRLEMYDSMGCSEEDYFQAMRDYLKAESQDKLGRPFDLTGWTDFACPRDECPQQANGNDCGMFAICFAECASRGAPFHFTQDDMPYLRRRAMVELRDGALFEPAAPARTTPRGASSDTMPRETTEGGGFGGSSGGGGARKKAVTLPRGGHLRAAPEKADARARPREVSGGGVAAEAAPVSVAAADLAESGRLGADTIARATAAVGSGHDPPAQELRRGTRKRRPSARMQEDSSELRPDAQDHSHAPPAADGRAGAAPPSDSTPSPAGSSPTTATAHSKKPKRNGGARKRRTTATLPGEIPPATCVTERRGGVLYNWTNGRHKASYDDLEGTTVVVLDPGAKETMVGIRFSAGKGSVVAPHDVVRFPAALFADEAGTARRARRGHHRRRKVTSMRQRDAAVTAASTNAGLYEADESKRRGGVLRQTWATTWRFEGRRIHGDERGRAADARRAAFDRACAGLCTPLPGDHNVLIAIGDGFDRPGGFGDIRPGAGGAKAPVRAFVDHLVRFAVGGPTPERGRPRSQQRGTVWVGKVDEWRSSCIGVTTGARVQHSRANNLRPTRCKHQSERAHTSARNQRRATYCGASKRATRWPDRREALCQPALNEHGELKLPKGCRCRCRRCDAPAERGRFCSKCFPTAGWTSWGVVVVGKATADGYLARTMNRDVHAACNLAFKLFAALLGIPEAEQGMWSRSAFDDQCYEAHLADPVRYSVNFARAHGGGPAPPWPDIFDTHGHASPIKLKDIRPARRLE